MTRETVLTARVPVTVRIEYNEDKIYPVAVAELLISLLPQLPEPERSRIHAATRKFSMSDQEILQLHYDLEGDNESYQRLLDIRDRYEERGRYAPAEGCQCSQYATDPNSGIRCHACKRPLAIDPREVFTPDRLRRL